MPIKNFGFLIFLFMTEIGAQISTCKQLDTCTWPRVGIPLFCCCGNLLLKCPSPKKKMMHANASATLPHAQVPKHQMHKTIVDALVQIVLLKKH